MLENDSKEDAQMKTTKRSMLVSGLCLLLTAVMLMGSTFAWFTDSVTNTGNVITAGNLSIDAFAYDVGTGGTTVTIQGVNGSQPITFEADGQDLKTVTTPILNGEIDWEPGMSDAKLLTVTNSGSLAANIRLSFAVTDGGLMNALWFDFIQVGATQGQFTKRPMSTLNQLAEAMVLTLNPGQSVSFVLVYGMEETAGNDYQGKIFSADVTVLATQAPVEEDGFGNSDYDAVSYVSNEAQLREAVAKGGNIVLQQDIGVTQAVAVAEGTTAILDLNGFSISAPEPVNGKSLYPIDNHGTLTIRDGSQNGSGVIKGRGVENLSGGVLYLESGTIQSIDSNGGGAAVRNEGTFYMTGGKLEFTGEKSGNSAGSPFNNQAGGVAVITGGELVSPYTCVFSSGDLTMKDITLTSSTDYWMTVKTFSGGEAVLENVTINTTNGGCLENAGGNVTLRNCTFTQSVTGNPAWNSCAIATSSGGTTVVESGTYTGAVAAAYMYNSGGTMVLKGGTYEGTNGVVLKSDLEQIQVQGGEYFGSINAGSGNAYLEISGGSFSVRPADDKLADGFTVTQSGDMWVVTAE